MMWPPPSIDAAEMRFHKLLAGVTDFAFDSGRLALSYRDVDGGGRIVFTRKLDGAAE